MINVRDYGDMELVLVISNDEALYETLSYYVEAGFSWNTYSEDMLSIFDANNCQWRELKKYFIEERRLLPNELQPMV